jgi:GT2 family glycosyltransferase
LGSQSFDDFDIVVVSNASNAQIQDTVSRSPVAYKARLIQSEINRGYGAACNLGARHSNAAFLVFLNDDTYFREDWLDELYKALCTERTTILQSTIFHELTGETRKGNPCDIYGAAGITFYRGCGTGGFFASGASLAMSKMTVDALGGFDEILFMYHDDVDLCWRARLMGFKISAAPNALCYHSGAGSSRSTPSTLKFYLTQRNRIRVLLKCYSRSRLLPRLLVVSVLIFTGAMLLALKARQVGFIVSGIKVFGWNLRILHNTLQERYLLQRKRAVDDSSIEQAMSSYSMDICLLKRNFRKV